MKRLVRGKFHFSARRASPRADIFNIVCKRAFASTSIFLPPNFPSNDVDAIKEFELCFPGVKYTTYDPDPYAHLHDPRNPLPLWQRWQDAEWQDAEWQEGKWMIF